MFITDFRNDCGLFKETTEVESDIDLRRVSAIRRSESAGAE